MAKNQKTIAIIASGGGHTAYAVAVAEELTSKADIYVVIPAGDRWTRAKMEKYGQVFETEKAAPGSSIWKRVLAVVEGFFQGLKLPKADVVVATGSNHSIGPALALKLRGAKLIVIEAIDRVVTKSQAINILSRFADIVALHWEEQKNNYPRGKVYGPILPKVKNVEDKKEEWILITMGTEGYREFFEYLAGNSDELFESEKIALQTGKVSPTQFEGKFWRVFDFDKNFELWLSGAKLVITHQGATAAESAILYRKPTIICFNKRLSGTSGREDTRAFAKLIGAEFCEDFEELRVALKKVKTPRTWKLGSESLAADILSLVNKK